MNKSFYNFEKIEVRGLFYFNFFNRNVQSKHACQLAYNGSQVYLVADLNAQNFQISNNLNKSTNVKFSTNSAIEYT